MATASTSCAATTPSDVLVGCELFGDSMSDLAAPVAASIGIANPVGMVCSPVRTPHPRPRCSTTTEQVTVAVVARVRG